MERFSAEATWLRGDNVHVNNSNESTELTWIIVTESAEWFHGFMNNLHWNEMNTLSGEFASGIHLYFFFTPCRLTDR